MTVFSLIFNLRVISFPSQGRKDGLLASSCLSVYPNVLTQPPLEGYV